MEPRFEEKDSRETAQHLVFVHKKLGEPVSIKYAEAADNYYGNPSLLNEMVVKLCAIISGFTDEQLSSIVYDGRNKKSRELATWWERHVKADAERLAEEAAEKKKQKLIESAKKKLTKAELEALGVE
jgi:uncharacterized protein YwgA